jgi:phosphoribosyl 1,2-cyclic phosphate phosphodiesterase
MTQLPIEDIEPGFDASFFECGYFENFGNGELMPKDHWLRWRLLPFDRQLELIDELKSKMTIICHLEDVWGRNYDDYLRLEQQNRSKNITFAIDGMIVEI